MPHLSLTEAAKQAGIGKTTLWRSIKNGKVSASRDSDGNWLIDPAELSRVYAVVPPVTDETGSGTDTKRDETGDETPLNALREVLAMKDDLIRRQDQEIDDLRNRLSLSEQERREATKTLRLLLTHQSTDPDAPDGSPLPLWRVLALVFAVSAVFAALFVWLKLRLVVT